MRALRSIVAMRQRYRTTTSGSGCRMVVRSARRPSGVGCVVSAERDVERLRLAVALELDGDLVARLVSCDQSGQVLGAVDAFAVELRDHVAFSDARLVRRRTRLQRHD